jgi:hypothetical protein
MPLLLHYCYNAIDRYANRNRFIVYSFWYLPVLLKELNSTAHAVRSRKEKQRLSESRTMADDFKIIFKPWSLQTFVSTVIFETSIRQNIVDRPIFWVPAIFIFRFDEQPHYLIFVWYLPAFIMITTIAGSVSRLNLWRLSLTVSRSVT